MAYVGGKRRSAVAQALDERIQFCRHLLRLMKPTQIDELAVKEGQQVRQLPERTCPPEPVGSASRGFDAQREPHGDVVMIHLSVADLAHQTLISLRQRKLCDLRSAGLR